VVRHDAAERTRSMDERLAKAQSADEIVDALVVGLEEFLHDDAGGQAVIYEMLSASRHSEEIRAELAELYRQWRERLAGWLRTKEREGVIRLQADPEAVASILFSLGDGFGIQVLADPDWDQQAAFDLGVATARGLLGTG
jgi:transcriptional regulator BetI-like protein